MSLYVVSDLHLSSSEDPLYLALIHLLTDRVKEGDTVVLAGDIFDLWVGHKKIFYQRYLQFFNALQKASQIGAQIYYIEGNHDFLLRRAFSKIPQVHVVTDETSLTLRGKKFFFAHGDCVNQRDVEYRLWRAFFRSPVMRVFLFLVPGGWLEAFGRWCSQYSRGRRPNLPRDWPTPQLEALRKIYRSFAAEKIALGYDFVVLGHCHDLDSMSFQVGHRTGQYINVGFPPVHGSFLTWSPEDSQIQRERFGIAQPPSRVTP
jgi:UDP-2,3-diacylglucosamine hydrolase